MGGAIFQRRFQDGRLQKVEPMSKTTRKRRRFWMPVVVVALGLTLGLGGCARNGAAGSGNVPSSQSTNGSGQSAGNSDVQQLEQLEQQTQNDVNGLNNDQNNANQNAGNDQETQP
jgi:hypothetical protein